MIPKSSEKQLDMVRSAALLNLRTIRSPICVVIVERTLGPGEYAFDHSHASVTVVDKVFDAASATIGVRLELPNPDYALPAGLKCQVRFPGIG